MKTKYIMQHSLTRLAGFLASRPLPVITPWFIRRFITYYGVNMAEAQCSEVKSYATFNAFFGRRLKATARLFDKNENELLSPVDGAVSQVGGIDQQQLIQAKGHRYSLKALLAGDEALAKQFTGGAFATLYLAPKDYHRIHMPCTGTLRTMVHVPGTLYSVNAASVEQVPGLFARNERVITLFDTAHGPMALVMVGATIVGSVVTQWHGPVKGQGSEPTYFHYDQGASYEQGQDVAHFQLGSTVIVLCAKEKVTWEAGWMNSKRICLGQKMAQCL